mgnify:CR=1 FL=1
MSWPTVGVNDLVDRWKPLTAEQTTVAEKRLADAVAELNTELRNRGLTGTPTFAMPDELADWQSLYVSTVVTAVKREMQNPDGFLEEREEIDDYARTRRRDSKTSTGFLYFSDDEVDKLVVRRRRRGSFTIRLGAS